MAFLMLIEKKPQNKSISGFCFIIVAAAVILGIIRLISSSVMYESFSWYYLFLLWQNN